MVFTVYGPRGIGGRRQNIRERRDADDVRRVAASGAFGVIGMDRASGDGGYRRFQETGFVDRVGVDGGLDVEFVGDFQARVNRCGRGAPIFVQLQPAGAGFDLFDERRSCGAISLP